MNHRPRTLDQITRLAKSRVATVRSQKTVELDQCSAIRRDAEDPYRTVLRMGDRSERYSYDPAVSLAA